MPETETALNSEPEVRKANQSTMRSEQVSKLLLPTNRNAPRFDGGKPKEILRFLSQMETMFNNAGITDDEDRKAKIVEYTDPETEAEWKGFDTYTKGTWSEFVSEIKSSYPEAEVEVGSVANLEKICREHARLSQKEASELYSLVRKFRAEGKKLMKVVGNGPLIDKFLQCLTPSFAEIVRDKLLMKYGHYKDRKRHKDDKYDLTEVLELVLILADEGIRTEARESRRTVLYEQQVQKTEPSDQTVALLRDTMDTINKELNAIKLSMSSMTAERRNGMGTYRLDPSAPTLHSSQLQVPRVQATDNCFYCWFAGHRVAKCPHLHKHVELGIIILIDGRPRLPNGNAVPMKPSNLSPMERVNQLQNQSVVAFYGWTEETEELQVPAISIYTNATRDTRDDLLDK
ncbi:hypothetical protein H0H93_011497, partial [Arthromyces matolae]